MKKEKKEALSENKTRRDFLKYSSMLGGAALVSSPFLAMAEKEEEKTEKTHQAAIPKAAPDREGTPGGGWGPAKVDFKSEEIGKALKVLYRTYSTTKPYQHKFNDCLTKAWLNATDFAVSRKEAKEFTDHYVELMTPILLRGKKEIAKYGKDWALTTIFDGALCSVQLFEEIIVKENERNFPCPYKSILEVSKKIGMFPNIEWKDVCNNLCIPVYTGFAKVMDVELKMTPGEICMATI